MSSSSSSPSSDGDVVICVDGLSKRYLVGHEKSLERYHSFRDTAVRHGKNLVRKTVDMARGRQIIQGDSVEEFWALQDVSFEVKRGEVLGIIGRNGAGKSTLLKILSRITEPTSGRVTLRGRVASLLEVGTGFHPELTGRENIFLNGAILGMRKAEIKSKFDEIVAFAEIEKFLDTPVKRYSSGMYVRLAFAVAAHLETEILIVDEVLAVGDQQFQKKCLGKMHEAAQGGGKTVLFVSHNMGVVRSLCQKAFQLQQGRLVAMGSSADITSNYLVGQKTGHAIGGNAVQPLDVSLDLIDLTIAPHTVASGDPLKITVTVLARQRTALHEASVIIHSENGTRVAILDLRQPENLCRLASGETATYEITIPELPFMEGLYEVGFYFRSDLSRDEFFALRDLVVLAGSTGCLVAPYPAQNRGFVELDYQFAIHQATPASA